MPFQFKGFSLKTLETQLTTPKRSVCRSVPPDIEIVQQREITMYCKGPFHEIVQSPRQFAIQKRYTQLLLLYFSQRS